MRKGLFMLVVLMMVVSVAACGNANNGGKNNDSSETITVTHELDTTEVPLNPQKVVVFDFGTLDTLDKLGVKVTGLPQSNVPTYLAKYEDAEYKNVGGLKEPDFEAIHAMDPDLIIISGRQSSSYDQFKEIAPTIYMGVDAANYMESFESNVTLLGKIFGKEDAAKEELTKIKDEIQKLHDQVADSGKKGLVTLVTGGKVSAYGPGSRFGIVHDVFGVEPVDSDIEASTHGMSVAFEYIAEKNPDYLFVVDRDAVVSGGGEAAKEVIENELVKNTNAYKNGHIVYLDANYWYLSGGGLISVSEMVKEIQGGL